MSLSYSMAQIDPFQQTNVITGPNRHDLINRLPNELLLEIFILHVWASYGSPVGLILVCKRWEVVGSFTSLWTNIFYGHTTAFRLPRSKEEDLRRRIKAMVRCSTPEQLEVALKKAKSAKIELTIHIHPDQAKHFEDSSKIVKKAISDNCRLLTIVGSFHPKTNQTLFSSLGSIPFKALEQFDFIGWDDDVDASCLGKNLYENSPCLRNISTPLFESWNDFSQLLPRLTKLFVSRVDKLFYDRTASKRTFEKLEELTIRHRGSHILSKGRTGFLPMPALKRVTIKMGSLYDLAIDIYAQITHLTLESFTRDLGIVHESVYLPLLTCLHLQGSWVLLGHLNALRLVTLLLHGQSGLFIANPQGSDVVRHIHSSTLLPEILVMHKTISQDDLTKFVSRIGANLRELSITHVKRDDTICQQLASALAGSKKKQPICPFLQKLETIAPRFGDKKLELYKTTEQRLRKVMDAMAPRGALTRVRSGYYTLGEQRVEDQQRWRIEWKELLWV
jgi:hypothetical protein